MMIVENIRWDGKWKSLNGRESGNSLSTNTEMHPEKIVTLLSALFVFVFNQWNKLGICIEHPSPFMCTQTKSTYTCTTLTCSHTHKHMHTHCKHKHSDTHTHTTHTHTHTHTHTQFTCWHTPWEREPQPPRQSRPYGFAHWWWQSCHSRSLRQASRGDRHLSGLPPGAAVAGETKVHKVKYGSRQCIQHHNKVQMLPGK